MLDDPVSVARKRQERIRPRRLWIKAAYFLPVTINLVDPYHDEGLLVLSPRMGHESNAPRPQFIVTKRHEQTIFDFYWGTIRNSFDGSGWIDIEDLPR
jgi:hypothetical protein